MMSISISRTNNLSCLVLMIKTFLKIVWFREEPKLTLVMDIDVKYVYVHIEAGANMCYSACKKRSMWIVIFE